ncbi:MAG: hypothetical protein JST51_11100 [Armatimonadetes bacterium]|nr:hypothetical protein [Armatimonadota bacterium]
MVASACGIFVIAATVVADMQGLCLRNDPAWAYVNPPGGCTADAQCMQEKHTTGSSCQYGPYGWCHDSFVYAFYYEREGYCISDPGGNYCDFTNVSWTTVTDNPDYAPTCQDFDNGTGGDITN